ncbi:bifunctional diguanylate cyclase/phosphodiesterase [Rhizobium sp. RU20A]|uniref:bifunctional diguanylate cyclase/phosphodiesterase n=1 Tax=Rhizobium sp. RU20A TaxID=1907412 RepID=UPI00165F4344|nr:bifunctional diguanylate cyclase/phosphodiesterase [Rhizobium sp. RU20A]
MLRPPVDPLELVTAVYRLLASASQPSMTDLLDRLPGKVAFIRPDGAIAHANRQAAVFWRADPQAEMRLGPRDAHVIDTLADAGPGATEGPAAGRMRLSGEAGDAKSHLVLVSHTIDPSDHTPLRAVIAIPDDLPEAGRGRPFVNPEGVLANLAALISKASRERGLVALHLIHVAGLAEINSTFGPIVGDGLMGALSSRLAALASAEMVTVARLTGNEFAILQACADAADTAPVEGLARRLATIANETVTFAGQRLEPEVRLGVACGPRDGTDAGSLRRAATAAVLQARLGKGGGDVVFASSPVEIKASPDLAQALRAALAADGLAFHYQPQVDLRTGRYDGVEALLRWPRGDHGDGAPRDILALADREGFLPDLTGWCAVRLAREHARLAQAADGDLRVCVHLSAAQLRLPALAHLLAPLREGGSGPVDLILPLAALCGTDGTPPVLVSLSALGFGLTLTLSEEEDMPPRLPVGIDRLKIDARHCAVLDQLSGSAMARSVPVIGANVEEATQLVALRAADCAGAQGYYIQPPVPLADMISALRTVL